MAKFKLTLKRNPQRRDQEGKWYATPVVENALNTRTVCRSVTRNTTVSPIELESSMSFVCDGIPPLLQQGNSVRIGSLGTMRLSFGSTGADEVDAFNAGSMIKNIKVIFTPSKELMTSILDGLSFENAGVVEEGFTYPSIKAYKEYQVTARNGGGTPEDPSA